MKRSPKGNARGWWCDIWGRVSGVTQRSGVRREDAGPVPMCCTLARTKKVDTPSGAQVSIKKLTFKVRPLLSYLRYAAQRRPKGNARNGGETYGDGFLALRSEAESEGKTPADRLCPLGYPHMLHLPGHR